MLTRNLLNDYKNENLYTIRRESEAHKEIAVHLIENGDIFFENYQPYLKFDNFYAAITDKNVLCSAVRRHIAERQRPFILNSTIFSVIDCIADSENLQIDLESAREENKYLINFSNGVYDIMKQKLMPHDINYRFDYCLDAEYIAPEKRVLKEYNYFVDSSIGKQNEESVLNTIGLAVSSIRDAKKMIVILGKGDSGKSKICDIIECAVGVNYVVTNAVDKIGSEKAIASYAGGKRVNLSRDTTIGVIKEDGGFKSVISCEAVNGRLLYHNEISVVPRILCIAASNEFPKFKNADDATINRVVPVLIQGYIGNPDPKFAERLLKETNSIVSLAVDNLKNFVKSNYDFKLSEESKAVLDHEYKKIHMVESFTDECCMIDDKLCVSSTELYGKYCGWCEVNGIDPLGKTKFFDKIKSNIKTTVYKKVPCNGGYVNGFYGIGINEIKRNVCNDISNKISKGDDIETVKVDA